MFLLCMEVLSSPLSSMQITTIGLHEVLNQFVWYDVTVSKCV